MADCTGSPPNATAHSRAGTDPVEPTAAGQCGQLSHVRVSRSGMPAPLENSSDVPEGGENAGAGPVVSPQELGGFAGPGAPGV